MLLEKRRKKLRFLKFYGGGGMVTVTLEGVADSSPETKEVMDEIFQWILSVCTPENQMIPCTLQKGFEDLLTILTSNKGAKEIIKILERHSIENITMDDEVLEFHL